MPVDKEPLEKLSDDYAERILPGSAYISLSLNGFG